ncbi:MAG: hypothetical protein FJ215_09255 [Ignavibacteria bacterium]|nr:hypothetical protein [Ignavibacteria bacterium]
MKIKIVPSMMMLFISVSAAFAQEFRPTYRWFGDVRIRGEVDMRDFNQVTAANTVTLLRTRLGLEAIPIENVRVIVQARDSRVFGQERDAGGSFNTLSDSRNLDLHQGYVEINKLFADELSLRAGRMEMSYANERIIGTVGWHNVGRVFDGALVNVNLDCASFDLFATNVGEVQPYVPVATPTSVRYVRDVGFDFYGLYATLKKITDTKLDAYLLYQWDRNQTVLGKSDLKRYTVGSYVKGKQGSIDYEAEVAYQGGDRRGADVSAYLLTGAFGYSFPGSRLSRVSLGYELLSGTPVGETKYKTFDPLYATNHKFYGFMDYFIAIPANTGDRGLEDFVARATFALGDNLSANLWLHNFSYGQPVGGESALGQEVDIVASYRYNAKVAFELGASTFIPAHNMRVRFGGADAALWGYLSLMVTF